jgi:serine/threonine protein kinase
VAKHRILVELGQGGMAHVYLAVAQGPGDFHKLVVLKALRPELAQDATFRDMAVSEARIAARLNHPNVVQTYEILNDEGRPVIVMEFLEGQSLSTVLARAREGTFPLDIRLRVLADALTGLHHAHELSDFDGLPFGLVHRDFTPQNIFVGYDGHVKVLDFGIAKTLASANETRTGTIKGKVRYMAPEQIVGTQPLDRRADIFSAGMVLWQLSTGELPWSDQADITIINRIINGELPSINDIAPDVPKDVARIFVKATEHERGDRYATAADMVADIEQVLASLDSRVGARDIGAVVLDNFGEARAAMKKTVSNIDDETAAPIAVPQLRPPTPSQRTIAERAGGRRWSLWWSLGVAAIGVAGAAVLLFGRRERDHGPSAVATPADPAMTASSVPETASAAPSPRDHALVEIRVRAIPSSAVLFFDDERLAGNPAVITRTADESLHTVRAEARGYATRAVQIGVDNGVDLVLTLDRAPNVRARPPTPRTAPPARSSEASPDCTPPFYIDEHGFKKFKPECI